MRDLRLIGGCGRPARIALSTSSVMWPGQLMVDPCPYGVKPPAHSLSFPRNAGAGIQ